MRIVQSIIHVSNVSIHSSSIYFSRKNRTRKRKQKHFYRNDWLFPLVQLLCTDQCIASQPVTVYKWKVSPVYTGEPLAQGALPEPEAARLGSPLSGKGCEPSRGDSPVSNSTLTFWCLSCFSFSFFWIVLLVCLLDGKGFWYSISNPGIQGEFTVHWYLFFSADATQ